MPAGALDLAAHRILGRQHRHLKAGLRATLWQIEEFEKVDVLRPQVGGAVELDVLALVLPGRNRREARRLPLRPGPKIEINRRAGRMPGNAAERDLA